MCCPAVTGGILYSVLGRSEHVVVNIGSSSVLISVLIDVGLAKALSFRKRYGLQRCMVYHAFD